MLVSIIPSISISGSKVSSCFGGTLRGLFPYFPPFSLFTTGLFSTFSSMYSFFIA